jgi:hypothetical protein
MRVNVLCQCGWGLLAIPEEDVPEFCPVCGFRLWDLMEDQPANVVNFGYDQENLEDRDH